MNEDIKLTTEEFKEAVAEGVKRYLEENVWWMEGYALVDVLKAGIAMGTKDYLEAEKEHADLIKRNFPKGIRR